MVRPPLVSQRSSRLVPSFEGAPPRPAWALLAPALLLALAACESRSTATPRGAAQAPAALIQDQAHQGGAVGFYFLPPMVAQPALAGAFDKTLEATVRIRELLDPAGTPGALIAEYSRTAGTGGVVVEVKGDHYQVNWKLKAFHLREGSRYRITVSSSGKEVGVADVQIADDDGHARNAAGGDVISLEDDETLPIKFWMNRCAPVVCGACAVANSCAPATGACAPKPAGTVCRESAGACDPAEVCDGASAACPDDARTPAGTVCRAANGICDVAEVCDGSSAACPDDAKVLAGTVCRASTGECDPAEVCDVTTDACPADALSAAGAACSSDGNYCTLDVCDGATATCRHPSAGICARDWAAFPSVVEIDAAPELWAMSDVHGDYAAYTRLLTGAGLIAGVPASPDLVQWTGGKAVFVIVGDLIDKGPDSHDVVRLTAALQASAAAAGGRVVVTLGNHEAEFLGNPENSKAAAADGLDPELAALGLTPEDTAAGNNELGAFLRDLPVAARVNDWFFVHAGKTGGRSVSQLRLDLQTALDSRGFSGAFGSTTDPTSLVYDSRDAAVDLGQGGTLLEARLNATTPPTAQWWDAVASPSCAGLAAPQLQTCNTVQLLTDWTAALGVKHLAMGHQPGAVNFLDGTKRAKDAMFQYHGLIFLIDTGLSVGADKTGGALLHVVNPGAPDERWERVSPANVRTTF